MHRIHRASYHRPMSCSHCVFRCAMPDAAMLECFICRHPLHFQAAAVLCPHKLHFVVLRCPVLLFRRPHCGISSCRIAQLGCVAIPCRHQSHPAISAPTRAAHKSLLTLMIGPTADVRSKSPSWYCARAPAKRCPVLGDTRATNTIAAAVSLFGERLR